MIRRAVCLAALLVLAPSRSATAQSAAGPVELAVDPAAREDLDPETLRAALAAELGGEVVVVEPDASATDAVRIGARLRGARTALLELVRADGSRLRRRVRLEGDAGERVATVVILAANMLRDEAGELLALLRDRDAGETSTGGSEAEPEVIAEPEEASEPAPETIVEPPPETSEPAPIVEPPPEPTPEVVAAPEPIAGPAREPTPPAAPAPPGEPYLRLGLDAQLGSVPGAGGALELAWLAGLHLAWTPLSFLAVGVRELGGGLSRSERFHAGGAPFVEGAWRFAEWGALHGALAVHVQFIGGGALEGVAGVAPLVVLGGRLFPVPFFSIAIETELRVVATDLFHTGIELVPQGAVLWTGGLGIAFHVS